MLLRHLATVILGVLFVSVITYMVVERRRHQSNLNKIPLRVLVNGSRGKSSTTRLIRCALAADENKLIGAKTTGSAARFIAPSGRETPIIRKNAIVNVIEQVAVVSRAVVFEVHAFVVECMAVDPGLQRLNTEVFVQPHITVITNARPDHLDEMGGPDRNVQGVARSLAGSLPAKGGVCITAEQDPEILAIFREEADRRGTQLILADPSTVSEAEMAPFPWICFPDNVAIALAVAAMQGIPRPAALKGMYACAPDPGVLRVDDQHHKGVHFKAVNLFAANDPQSTLDNIGLLRKLGLIPAGISLVINCRPDRLERNGQMGSICEVADPEVIFLVGHPTKSAADQIPQHLQNRVVDLEGDHLTGDDYLDAIAAHLPPDPDHAIVLVGNIHHAGERVLHALHLAQHAGPALDTALQAVSATRLDHIPVQGLDKTLVWKDDGNPAVVIPAPAGPDAATAELSLVQIRDAGRHDPASTAVLSLQEIRAAGAARRLFLREPAQRDGNNPN